MEATTAALRKRSTPRQQQRWLRWQVAHIAWREAHPPWWEQMPQRDATVMASSPWAFAQSGDEPEAIKLPMTVPQSLVDRVSAVESSTMVAWAHAISKTSVVRYDEQWCPPAQNTADWAKRYEYVRADREVAKGHREQREKERKARLKAKEREREDNEARAVEIEEERRYAAERQAEQQRMAAEREAKRAEHVRRQREWLERQRAEIRAREASEWERLRAEHERLGSLTIQSFNIVNYLMPAWRRQGASVEQATKWLTKAGFAGDDLASLLTEYANCGTEFRTCA